MKCYFALTAPDKNNAVYTELFEVALKSARQNTTLDLYALYDGPKEHPCYTLMEKYAVKIIEHQFSHKNDIAKTYTESYLLSHYGKVIPYEKLAGTFMRLDIPFIEKTDDFVLYSDIDVIFLEDIKEEDFPKTKYLAAVSEFSKNIEDDGYFNAGILFMNIEGMKEKASKIFDDLNVGKANETGIFDQGYLNQYCYNDLQILPLEYNWKPYWGYNEKAKIIHFHGIKPGGTLDNSGFNLDNSFFDLIYSKNKDFISGLIFYFNIYFKILEKDGVDWTAKFISAVSRKLIESSLTERIFDSDNPISTKLFKFVLKKYLREKLKI